MDCETKAMMPQINVWALLEAEFQGALPDALGSRDQEATREAAEFVVVENYASIVRINLLGSPEEILLLAPHEASQHALFAFCERYRTSHEYEQSKLGILELVSR